MQPFENNGPVPRYGCARSRSRFSFFIQTDWLDCFAYAWVAAVVAVDDDGTAAAVPANEAAVAVLHTDWEAAADRHQSYYCTDCRYCRPAGPANIPSRMVKSWWS